MATTAVALHSGIKKDPKFLGALYRIPGPELQQQIRQTQNFINSDEFAIPQGNVHVHL